MSAQFDSGDPFGIVDGFTPAEDYVAPEAESRLLGRMRDLFQRAASMRTVYSRDWAYNKALLSSDQLLYRDVNTHEIVRVVDPGSSKRLYSVNNVIQPTARYLHGKLCRRRQTRTVTPSAGTQSAVNGARAAEAFIKCFDRKWQIGSLMARAYKSVVYSGNAVIQLAWDPLGGKCLAYCATCKYVAEEDLIGAPCPNCNQGAEVPMEGSPTLEKAYEGCERPIVHDVEKVYVDPGATTPDELSYVIIQHNMTIPEIRKAFPEKGRYVEPGPVQAAPDVASQIYDTRGRTINALDLQDRAIVWEYHEKPSAQWPKGRIIFATDGVLLSDSEGLHHLFGRLPFFFQFWWQIPGRFWAQSFIDHARGRQKELNEIETQMREHTALISRTKVMAKIGSGLSADEWTASTGQVIFTNPSMADPYYIQPPSLPGFVENRAELLKQSITQHAAVTAAEMGSDSGDPTGRALAIMQAEGDQQIQGMMEVNNAEITSLYKCMLKMVKHYYSPDRKFVVAGEFGPEVYSFEDIHFDDDCDIELELEDGFSNNAQVRQQQVANLIGMGFFMNPQTGRLDEARAAKAAKLKIPVQNLEMRSADYANAQANLRMIELGNVDGAMPTLSDDPQIYSETYLEWLKTKGRRMHPMYVQQVTQLYMYYQAVIMQSMMGAAPPPPPDMHGGAPGHGPSQPGQNQSAPGGTPNNPTGMGAEQTRDHNKSVAAEAGSRMAVADRNADAQAKQFGQ